MEIDFIKWMCEKAGYYLKPGYYPEGFWLCYGENFNIRLDDELLKDSPIYRDFIQRAIEGVNMGCDAGSRILEVVGNCSERYLKHGIMQQIIELDNINIDQAKELALRCVWEQEK